MRALILAALLAAAPLAVQAGDETKSDPISPLCAQPGACRPTRTLTLDDGKGGAMTVLIDKPTPWLQNNNLTLMPGETVTLRFSRGADGGLNAEVVSAGLADPADTDDMIRRHLQVSDTTKPDDQNLYTVRGLAGAHQPPPRDTVRFTFRQAAGRVESVLIVEDGYQGTLRYRATMLVDEGAARPTDVCDVQGGRLMVEQWPHPIFVISLTGLRLIPPQLDENGAPTVHCE